MERGFPPAEELELLPENHRQVEAFRALLLVQLDELEPQWLSGYGVLGREQAAILRKPGACLRHLASSPPDHRAMAGWRAR